MDTIRAAVEQRDAEGVRQAAHKFQAQVGAFSESAQAEARGLSQAADPDEAFAEFARHVERVAASLREWVTHGR